MGFLTGLNPQALAVKAILAILAAGAVFAGGFYVAHRMDASTLANLKLRYANAAIRTERRVAQIQQEQFTVSEQAAVTEAWAQQKIIVQAQLVTEGIPAYVQNNSHCITYGLVRVLDAAALGVSPSDLQAAARESNDACAPVTWRNFARQIADDYKTARANGQQLNDLEDAIRKLDGVR